MAGLDNRHDTSPLSDSVTQFRSWLLARQNDDLVGAVAVFADDCRFKLHVPKDNLEGKQTAEQVWNELFSRDYGPRLAAV